MKRIRPCFQVCLLSMILVTTLTGCRYTKTASGSKEEQLSRPSVLSNRIEDLESDRDRLERLINNDGTTPHTCAELGEWAGQLEATIWIIRKNEVKSRLNPATPLTGVLRLSSQIETETDIVEETCRNPNAAGTPEEKRNHLLETMDRAATALRALRREVETVMLRDFEKADPASVKNEVYPAVWRDEILRVKNELATRQKEYNGLGGLSNNVTTVCLTLGHIHGHHEIWYREFLNYDPAPTVRSLMLEGEQTLRDWRLRCQSVPNQLMIPVKEVNELQNSLTELLNSLFGKTQS